MFQNNDSLRLSEAIPQDDTPPRVTDHNLAVTCPRCKIEWRMDAVQVTFTGSSSTYSCPTDGSILCGVETVPSTRELVVNTPHGMTIRFGD